MSIKHIVVVLNGETESTSVPGCALHLAQKHAAHVTGIESVMDEPMYPNTAFAGVASAYNVELTKTYDIIKKQLKDTAREVFEKARTHRGIAATDKPSDGGKVSASWRPSSEIEGNPIVTIGRLSDLIVLEQFKMHGTVSHFNAIESAIFAARRPTLLTPLDCSELGSTAALAWNGSVEAASVVVQALPLLAGAKDLDIIQVGEIRRGGISTSHLIDYLGWHGLTARLHEISDKPKSTAKLILHHAEKLGSDFLMMGAYGRNPLREAVFGGVTQYVIKNTTLPILFAH